jgi:hypothetical protein
LTSATGIGVPAPPLENVHLDGVGPQVQDLGDPLVDHQARP